MGNKKFLLVAFVLAALVGCDQVGEKKDVSTVQDSKTASTTALYLPGGVGIDFGVAPVKDEVVDYKGSNVRIVTYQLDAEAADIDSAVSAILQTEGYKRKENPKGKNDLSVNYHSSSVKALFRYKKVVSEGFVKYTRVQVSWKI